MPKPLPDMALKLAEVRRQTSLSRDDFGRRLGWKGSRVQDIERGRSRLNQEDLGRIQAAFGVDLEAMRAPDHVGEPEPLGQSLGAVEFRPYDTSDESPTPSDDLVSFSRGPSSTVMHATGSGKTTQGIRSITQFGERYRAAVHLVDTVLTQTSLQPTPLLREALKTLAYSHQVSPENLALLVNAIEQQTEEGKG